MNLLPLTLRLLKDDSPRKKNILAAELLTLSVIIMIITSLIGLKLRSLNFDLGVITGVLLGPALTLLLSRLYVAHLPWLKDEPLDK
jgi:hypothetical protein